MTFVFLKNQIYCKILSQFHQHKFSLTKSYIACCSCDDKSLFHKKCHTTSTFIIYCSFPAFSRFWYLVKMPSSKGLVNQCKIEIYVLASPIPSVCFLSVYLNWYEWKIYGGAVELDWMKWLLLTQCHQYREGFNLTRPQPSLGPWILLRMRQSLHFPGRLRCRVRFFDLYRCCWLMTSLDLFTVKLSLI